MFKKIANGFVVVMVGVGVITTAQAGPAVVVNPGGMCAFFDGNGDVAITDDTKIVATQSQNGNSLLKCKANVTPPATGAAAHFDYESTGVGCVIANPLGYQYTTQWKETVSASGEAMLTCHVTKQP